MSNLSPLVNRVKDVKPKAPSINSKGRKVRSDKKHDIRIPVNENEKWWVRLLAGESVLSMTQFTTLLVEKGLTRNIEFPECSYVDSENIVHAKVDQMTYKELVRLQADWDCSIRKAAHRVFKYMLILEMNHEG
ncbi:hypothetical protein QTG56_23170 (plasmid) [Rossellomorea sp. AcN35-11]|nr:hypothetical protein [Rossellomorea aquimaris]WJV32268.1 hypothetical protein QTG56_23170 [Rossellomorea sp. AcN35-11]